MKNLLPYIPFLNYKETWINEKLILIQTKRNHKLLIDDEGYEIDWDIVKFALRMYYGEKFFGSRHPYDGLRLNPYRLMAYIEPEPEPELNDYCPRFF